MNWKTKRKGEKTMTDERLQKGRELQQAINKQQKALNAVKTHGVFVYSTGLSDHLAFSEPAYQAVRALAVSDLEAQLRTLRAEYEAL